MPTTQAPKIITLDVLDEFKGNILSDIHLLPENSNNINSIIQIGANEDKNTGEVNVLKVKNSVVFGSNHTANALNNIFIAGRGNIATTNNQIILGNFNKEDSNALFILGKGTNNTHRANALTVQKNGDLKLNGLNIHETTESIDISATNDKKIVFNTDKLYNNTVLDLSDKKFISTVLSLDDKVLVTADIIKQIIKALALYLEDGESGITDILSTKVNTLTDWKNDLVQDLTYAGDDKNSKALSIAAGLELQSLIENKNDANVTDLRNEIATLKEQISYLISSLTVDKISNADTEYYTVGVADFAFDADTKFKIAKIGQGE